MYIDNGKKIYFTPGEYIAPYSSPNVDPPLMQGAKMLSYPREIGRKSWPTPFRNGSKMLSHLPPQSVQKPQSNPPDNIIFWRKKSELG